MHCKAMMLLQVCNAYLVSIDYCCSILPNCFLYILVIHRVFLWVNSVLVFFKACWGPNDVSVVFVGWFHEPYRLGLVYALTRK